MDVIIFSDCNGVIGFGRYGGAYKVATELRRAGYSVQVVEFFADLSMALLEQIADKYIDKNTLFVGFATSLFIRNPQSTSKSRLDRSEQNKHSGHLPQDNDFVQDMFAMFRRRNSKIKIVIGGSRAAKTHLQGVDYWVWGYADTSIIALADHLKHGRPLTTLSAKQGLALSGNDYQYTGFSHSKIDWVDDDFIFKDEHLPIEISRGCIFRCNFCANALFKRKGEMNKSLYTLREELIYNYETFGTTGYMFCDDTYNDTIQKVEMYHKVFSDLPFEIEWTGYGRVDTIRRHPEMRELLLESGLRAILIGVESLHPVAAKGVGKGLQPDQLKETLYYVKETWKDDITITGAFIVGLPGEPEESIWKTVEWLNEPDCPVDEAVFSPLNIRGATDDPGAPSSKISRNPDKYGYDIIGSSNMSGASSHGPDWVSEHMTKPYAENLTREAQAACSSRQPVSNWAVYSRLCSLGYEPSEFKGTSALDTEFIQDADQRKDVMRRTYFEKLIS